jgi:hypothetical protein
VADAGARTHEDPAAHRRRRCRGSGRRRYRHGAREAQAANDIRTAADLVGSATPRANLYAVADAFDELSRSRLTPSSPAAPSKDYFSATTRMSAAIHDIKQACPTIGEGTPVTP